jgi:hypothetical protein
MRPAGQWGPELKRLALLPEKINRAMERAASQSAHHIEAVAKRHLRNQDLDWKELSPAYKKRKEKTPGLSEKTLIATSSYMQAITTSKEPDGYLVGVKRGVKNEKNQEIVEIAIIHEEGENARPLWKPTFEETQSKVKDNFRRAGRAVRV